MSYFFTFCITFVVMTVSSYKHKVAKKDGVIEQYMALPYPHISERELIREKEYYREGKHFRYIHPSLALEELNHYLYKGNQTFRL